MRGVEKIHPHPPELAARHYESFEFKNHNIQILSGFWRVGIEVEMDHEYVIGFIESGRHGQILCPFVAPTPNHNNTNGRIKIRLDGDHANVFVPILENDPVNDLFFKERNTGRISVVQVKLITEALPLILADH